MINKSNAKEKLFLTTQGQATLHIQQTIPPATVTQPGAHEINLFSTDHEIISQNAEASRSQLVTPATNAQLVASEAVELLAGQSADQIQLWTNVTTQAQLEDYTIRSHLAADLIRRPAAPILETGLPASARNTDKILHDLQSQLIVAWRLVVLVLTHVLDFQLRETFVDALNLLAWLWHLGERFIFARYTLARGTANQTPELRRNTLESTITQTEQTNMVANQASLMLVTGTDLLTIGRNLQTQYNLTNMRQTPAKYALTTAMILARMLGRAPNVLLVSPIAADLIRPRLLNFPTQEEIYAYHSNFPYQQQTRSFGIQQQGPFNPFNIQQPFPQAPQAQNYFAGPPQQPYIQGQNPFPQINFQGQVTPTVPTQVQQQQQYQQQIQQPLQVPEPQLDQQQVQIYQQIEQQKSVQPPVQEIRLLQQPQVYQLQPSIFPPVQMQTLGVVQPPVQPALSSQMFQQERERDMERHQTHQKQMDISWERSPPSPNVNTEFGERPKGHFPRLEERMSKELVQQHRTTWNLEGYELVDQKSRHSDPPPAGYAEGNVQIRPFIEAHNRGHRFYIHEYQAFWKEYCYKLFKRKPQQSDMSKDSPRPPGRRHDNDKNDRRNRRDGKTSLAFMEAQFDNGINSEPNWIQQIEDNFWQSSNRLEPQVLQNNNPAETRIQALRLQRQAQGQNQRRNLLPLDMGLERQPANPDSRTQTPHVNITEMAKDKQIFLPSGLQRRSSWTDSEEEEEPNQINPMVPPKVSTQNVINNAIQTQVPERRPQMVKTSTQQRLTVQ
ncbi:MAG: hypothetical protein EZS28_031250, partial [Streblomastix strix]